MISYRHISVILGLLLLSAGPMNAQSGLDRIHIGLRGAWHGTMTTYSNLSPTIPDPKMLSNGSFGVFAEFETSESGFFSIRPELMFLQRGTKIQNIPFTALQQADYLLKAQYTDLRVPLIFNFGKPTGVRPYLFIAPVLGIVRGGTIQIDGLKNAAGVIEDRSIDIGKNNIAPLYFAGNVGLGIKFPIHMGSRVMHLGFDVTYEYGFTDTYSSKEKNGEVCCGEVFIPGWNVSDVSGTRKFTSIEAGLNISVPLSIFKHGKTVRRTVRYEEPRPVVVAKKRKSCYSLEEITELIRKGEDVRGLTICAIDLINFEHGKSTLTASSRTYLNQIATLMKNTGMKVEVKGHTDSTGSEEFNMGLSKRRAEAVFNYLIQRGVSRSKITYSYYGESQPIESNETEEGRRINRRVEFELK